MPDMTETDLRGGFPIFLAGYIKRILEGQYDALFATKLGQKVKGLSPSTKYSLEFLANALNGFFDQKLRANTTLGKIIKEVASDVASEFSKRMINGHDRVAEAKQLVRESAQQPEEKTFAEIMLDLDDVSFVALLDWLYTTGKKERAATCKFLLTLPPEQLQKFTTLESGRKEQFTGLFVKRRPNSDSGNLAGFATVFKSDLQSATAAMRATRERLKKIREGKR